MVSLIAGSLVFPLHLRLSKPLEEPSQVCFPASGNRDAELLDKGQFRVIHRVRDLPAPVRFRFTEKNGSRFVMADTGATFETSDDIRDASIPMMRLIFAAESPGATIVHYEHGGIGLYYVVEAFRTDSAALRPLWRRVCSDKARDLRELRGMISSGKCAPEPPSYDGKPPCQE